MSKLVIVAVYCIRWEPHLGGKKNSLGEVQIQQDIHSGDWSWSCNGNSPAVASLVAMLWSILWCQWWWGEACQCTVTDLWSHFVQVFYAHSSFSRLMSRKFASQCTLWKLTLPFLWRSSVVYFSLTRLESWNPNKKCQRCRGHRVHGFRTFPACSKLHLHVTHWQLTCIPKPNT